MCVVYVDVKRCNFSTYHGTLGHYRGLHGRVPKLVTRLHVSLYKLSDGRICSLVGSTGIPVMTATHPDSRRLCGTTTLTKISCVSLGMVTCAGCGGSGHTSVRKGRAGLVLSFRSCRVAPSLSTLVGVCHRTIRTKTSIIGVVDATGSSRSVSHVLSLCHLRHRKGLKHRIPLVTCTVNSSKGCDELTTLLDNTP